jgi:hypothetical protein
MGHHSYEEAKKLVWKGCGVLAVVTLVEVFVSLLQKGHVISGLEDVPAIYIGAAVVIAILSIYKAYYIIYNFMHMAHEVPGLRVSVLLPTALLIWAIIAFFQEGHSWGKSRQLIKEKNEISSEDAIKPQGMLLKKIELEKLQ